MPATDTEYALYLALGAYLAAFTDGVTTVASFVGGATFPAARIYGGSPPNYSTWPGTHIVMRILDPIASDYGGQERLDFTIENMYFARGREQTDDVLRLASLVDGAFLRHTIASAADGLVRVTGRDGGGLLPQGTNDMDREVVQYLARYSAFAWPRWLTKYSAP